MKIFYGKAVYGKAEINAAINVLKKKSLSLIDGPSVKELEYKIARLFGKKYGLMVNSGSSANLLALDSLNLKKGSEIITPTLTFSTTVSPIYQLGLVPHFIDVEEKSFVANTNQIEKSINKNTSAIIIPNLLGNLPNWKKIKQIAKKYKLKVIEDSADTIGYKYKKNKNFGDCSDVVTNSMYASHIITGAGFGGIVCFNDFKLYQRAKLLRGWGRSSATFNESEGIKLRFNKKVDGIPYDGKYIFSEMGYNFLPSEVSAAFALVQLKLNKIYQSVKEILKILKIFQNLTTYLIYLIKIKYIKTGWLAYPIILRNKLKFQRKDLQIYLEKRNIQTRTIFTGNILRQPIMRKKKFKKHSNASTNANNIMKNGILIGCHHGLSEKDLKFIKTNIEKFIKLYY